MKNTKELQPILISLWCLNFASDNRDKDIENILNYAFRSFFGANTNLLTLACVGKTRDEVFTEVMELLEHTTLYKGEIK